MTLACPTPGCRGTILADGYCDTCGSKGVAPAAVAAPPAAVPALAPAPAPAGAGGAPPAPGGDVAALSGRSTPLVTGSARAHGSRRSRSGRTRTSSRRSTIGAGIVEVPAAPAVDPSAVVMSDPKVAEDRRFCSKCGAPVGRSRGTQPGRTKGFCHSCRQPYDFDPKLAPGELVGGQYEVVGCLAHGGLGWIYLARDKAVNDRWVVLKGLLDAGDEAAMAAAVAEKRFLAQVEHPNIVEIYNFATARGSGYIVMEYVGGPSLKQVLKRRREANGGVVDPLPVEQAIAFVAAALPAFSYLHQRGLVYCDFKPDNLIQVGDQVKLIDLGGVRRIDDPAGDVYGTVGFQAPEIPTMGPSVASDVFTVGRTLAVLTLDFRGYQSTFEHTLPDPADHPVLVRHPSFHRFLLKATAPHPDDRFQSAAEAGDQLIGVLREVVATTTGTPQPGPSTVFAAAATDHGLPVPAADADDPAAAFVANLGTDDPRTVLATIADGLTAGQVHETIEVRLRRARALVDLDDHDGASAELDRVEEQDPWEWRAVWWRGVSQLDRGDLAGAAASFDRCISELPGEQAPKLAGAIAAERAGELARAAALYDLVSTVDPSMVGAAVGLARCRLARGDVDGALAAYGRVPRTHRSYPAAQRDAVGALAGAGRFADALALLATLGLGAGEQAETEVAAHEAALAALAGRRRADGKGGPSEREVRRGLERACRRLARLTADDDERRRLVDRANQVRPLTFV